MLEWLGGALVKGALDKVFDFVVKLVGLFESLFRPSLADRIKKIENEVHEEHKNTTPESRPTYGGDK
jgi:hypothetical protein